MSTEILIYFNKKQESLAQYFSYHFYLFGGYITISFNVKNFKKTVEYNIKNVIATFLQVSHQI